ncbi:MAG: RHS repeat-associated core domain-containing protein [Proteobacteria bacterium]|nr:RHS repeat-associated core domain-containing protein [Pseudomonadota bacterium]
MPNAGDRRLSGISNTGLTAGQFSNYTYTTTPENQIIGIAETSDASAVYPVASTQTATYNTLNQLTNLSGQALTFDANGNLTSDGQRTYTWDAENRLVGITYPGASGKATAFTYDGRGRRVSIASTPAGGGSAVTASYLWCGDKLCQARNGSNATVRSYYSESEFVPGTPNQTFYYGIDQIGSVRRTFASPSSAAAYSYDPYGVPLQSTAPVTDFVYGGMFYNADSGLYLTNYRAYDPVAGRWLSRDPLGEAVDPMGNLYPYVGGNPTNLTDPEGLQVVAPGPAIPLPLPPVFIPGTPENKQLTRQTMGLINAIGNTIEDTISLMGKESDKERSTDIPSWAKGKKPKPGQSGKEFADELLRGKYGEGKYPTGPGSEHSKIKKWADRGCK